MRRITAIVGLVVGLGIVSGCSAAPESRIDEYHTTADQLSTHIVERIPAELQPTLDAPTDSHGVAPQNAVAANRGPRDTARWEVNTSVRLVDRVDAAADAIGPVTQALQSEGWRSARLRETDGGTRVTDAFSRDGWHVEISWTRSEPGKTERFDIFVMSPDTIRGNHTELRS